MEEEKLSNLASEPHVNSQGVQWFWQADLDPWKEADPTKWKWTAYPLDDSERIESVFSLDQKVVDLGNYEIDLKKMLQINKKYRNRIRRIKREVISHPQSRFLLELPKPAVIDKINQTMNSAFGNVQHFLNYLMKRTPEAYKLFQRLQELNLDSKQNEYQDIIQEVIKCIQKGAESREKIVKSRALPNLKINSLKEAKQIVASIEHESSKTPDWKLKDFLKIILKIYTMETFICYWLNELLRSEDWEEINVLTPYLVCLTYTFQVKDCIIEYKEPQAFKENFLQLLKSRKLVLYRGTALTEEDLGHYRSQKNLLFSWNAVTSTSKSKEKAMFFVQNSLSRSQPGEKVGVLFTIEANFSSAADCEGMIDASHISQYKDEQEVILAPGSVFKVKEIKLNKTENIYEVKLKLKKKFKKNHKLLGDFQAKIISHEKAVLNRVTRKELIKALQLIEGNQLVSKLEIKECSLDCHLLELIADLRATTKIQKENIVLMYNTISLDRLSLLCYYFSTGQLDDILKYNKIIFNPQDQTVQLKAKEEQVLAQITDLSISCLNDLTHITDTLKLLVSLRNVSLKLCISDKEFDDLKDALKAMTSMQQLSLHFDASSKVSDQELIRLKDGLKQLKSLQQLSLDFAWSPESSGEGLSCLKDTLSLNTSLHLSLSFRECEDLSSNGLNSLKDTFLQKLSLDFSYGKKSVSEEVLNKITNALKLLTSLQYLSLNFCGFEAISDRGLISLTEAFKELRSLRHLSLEGTISDQGLMGLKDALKESTSLQHLNLNSMGSNISDQGLIHLRDILRVLPSLQHLSLNFLECLKISDVGLMELKDALRLLISLEHLTLCFGSKGNVLFLRGHQGISGKGLHYLTDALGSLTSLRHLCLNFLLCENMSDQGLNSLKNALKGLTFLQHLSLEFFGCPNISDTGLAHIKEALFLLTSLQHLSLGFGVTKISDAGLADLKELFKKLTSLQHLFLEFCYCSNISDKGVKSFKDAFKLLTSLKHLVLAFEFRKISRKGVNSLKHELNLLTPWLYSEQCGKYLYCSQYPQFDFWHQPHRPSIHSNQHFYSLFTDGKHGDPLAKFILVSKNYTFTAE